jgi:hypothetical protein
MKYLDPSVMPDFLAKYFGSPEMVESRRVGRSRQYISEYFDIVRFFGEGAVDPRAVTIRYLEGKFQLRDPLLREFNRQVEFQLRGERRLYDGPTVMRLQNCEWRHAQPIMTVQEADYGDQASSFALDLPHSLFERWGGSCRQYYKSVYSSTKLEDNPLCLCLGVCGYLLVEEEDDRYLLQVRRSGRLASLESSMGPSVAGAVDYSTDCTTLGDLITRAMGQEVEEELGLRPGEFEVHPLAYAREIYRGERPQLFCAVTSNLTRAEVTDRINSIGVENREFDSFSFIWLNQERSFAAETFEQLNFEARMNYSLLLEYLSQ